jgi:hypothetical protein
MNPLPKEIFQMWKHSYEEDTQDITVYRPVSYEFGPARGRSGIEFKQDGTFANMAPGPTDASQKVEGKWEMEKNDQIAVSFSAKQAPSQIIEILECNGDILKVRKHIIN